MQYKYIGVRKRKNLVLKDQRYEGREAYGNWEHKDGGSGGGEGK
jgi:hypothetical protein